MRILCSRRGIRVFVSTLRIRRLRKRFCETLSIDESTVMRSAATAATQSARTATAAEQNGGALLVEWLCAGAGLGAWARARSL